MLTRCPAVAEMADHTAYGALTKHLLDLACMFVANKQSGHVIN